MPQGMFKSCTAAAAIHYVGGWDTVSPPSSYSSVIVKALWWKQCLEEEGGNPSKLKD